MWHINVFLFKHHTYLKKGVIFFFIYITKILYKNHCHLQTYDTSMRAPYLLQRLPALSVLWLICCHGTPSLWCKPILKSSTIWELSQYREGGLSVRGAIRNDLLMIWFSSQGAYGCINKSLQTGWTRGDLMMELWYNLWDERRKLC